MSQKLWVEHTAQKLATSSKPLSLPSRRNSRGGSTQTTFLAPEVAAARAPTTKPSERVKHPTRVRQIRVDVPAARGVRVNCCRRGLFAPRQIARGNQSASRAPRNSSPSGHRRHLACVFGLLRPPPRRFAPESNFLGAAQSSHLRFVGSQLFRGASHTLKRPGELSELHSA